MEEERMSAVEIRAPTRLVPPSSPKNARTKVAIVKKTGFDYHFGICIEKHKGSKVKLPCMWHRMEY